MEKIDFVETPFWEFKGLSEETDKKFLMSTPFPLICILITYLWFVLKFGPEFMKHRKPFQFDRTLAVYNFVQVLGSMYILLQGFYIITFSQAVQLGWNYPICLSEVEYPRVSHACYCYFLAKVVELLDTVFFVLRKKQNQVSFLHVYHHTIMAFCTWCTVKYTASDSVIFIGMINTMVHVVMYGYYGLSTFPSLIRFLWWKKYITAMQLIQFCLIILNVVSSHYLSHCKKSYILLSAIFLNTVLFIYLFGQFYIKSYTKKSKTMAKTKNDLCKATEVPLNGDAKKGFNYLINRHKLAAKMN